jgi:hypothetical protein
MRLPRCCRDFGASLLSAAVGYPALANGLQNARDLVPGKPGSPPNYWCTWAAQNYLFGRSSRPIDVSLLEGARGAVFAQNLLNEGALLGANGLADFPPAARSDLYLVLDDGWQDYGTASLIGS